MSIHPRPLIVFQQNLIISLIRQPVRNNKFLILSGTTENIDNLDAKIEVYVTPDVVKHYYTSLKENHITIENLTGEPEEEDYYTGEEEEEKEQNPKDSLPGTFYKNAEQADTWMAKQEVFLTSKTTPIQNLKKLENEID